MNGYDSVLCPLIHHLVVAPLWVMHMLQNSKLTPKRTNRTQVLTYIWDGFEKHWQENRAQQSSVVDTQTYEAISLISLQK